MCATVSLFKICVGSGPGFLSIPHFTMSALFRLPPSVKQCAALITALRGTICTRLLDAGSPAVGCRSGAPCQSRAGADAPSSRGSRRAHAGPVGTDASKPLAVGVRHDLWSLRVCRAVCCVSALSAGRAVCAVSAAAVAHAPSLVLVRSPAAWGSDIGMARYQLV